MYYLLLWIKFPVKKKKKKKTGKMKKILEKSRNFLSPEKGETCLIL